MTIDLLLTLLTGADDSASAATDPLLYIVAGAFGAAVLTALAGFLGAAINARREHVRWIRHEQFSTYISFLQIVEKDDYPEHDDRRVYLNDLGSAFATVELVGPDTVARAANAHFKAALDYSAVARRFVDAHDAASEIDPDLTAEMNAETKRQADTRRAFVVAARKQLRM